MSPVLGGSGVVGWEISAIDANLVALVELEMVVVGTVVVAFSSETEIFSLSIFIDFYQFLPIFISI